jgi:prevent-host-death family protein
MAILAIMDRATITEVKNGLSALIDRVKAGESIVVTDRGIPVAIIEPVTDQLDVDERIAGLERAGLVRRGTGEIPHALLRTPGPRVRGPGNPAVDAVIEERREGR